jgi:dTDP-4-amino-4,6-dideoxygalactose transaminase
MWRHGVETGIHYARGCHQYSYYHNPKIKLPITEKIVQQLVSIPIYPDLNVEYVTSLLKKDIT